MQNKHVAIKVCMGILIPVCIVVGAALGAWMARTDISGILIALPFIPTALLFRYIASADRLVEAFVLLGVVALLTFIYPVVRSIKAKKFSRRFKGDIYDPDTIGMLGKLTKKCKVSIVYSLLAAVFLYVSMLLFALMGGTVTYSFDFSLISLLTVCLVIIFAGILKRSIAEHEENKLTI